MCAAGAGAAVPPDDGVPEQRVLEPRQPRGLRPLLRLRLPEGVLGQVQRRCLQVRGDGLSIFFRGMFSPVRKECLAKHNDVVFKDIEEPVIHFHVLP